MSFKTNLTLRYGRIDIIFAGDLRQLEPVGKFTKPIYEGNCQAFRDWIKCYLELGGIHRFRDDPEWGQLLLRLRSGKLTIQDINRINQSVVKATDTYQRILDMPHFLIEIVTQ